jgi:hypothetical protein
MYRVSSAGLGGDGMSEWKPLDGMELISGHYYDVFAKRWDAVHDRFDTRRFTNCRLTTEARFIGPLGTAQAWLGLDAGWFVTHYMPLPKPPSNT